MTKLEESGRIRLCKALRAVNDEYIEKTEHMPRNEINFSEKYEKFMERLIRNQKHPYRKLINTVGKRVAVFAVAVLLIFGLSMSISAIRKPVVEFFTTVYEKFTEIFFGDEDKNQAPETIVTAYTLGYIPDGYELQENNITSTALKTTWINDKNNIIIFSQTTIKQKSTIDNEDTEKETIITGGREITKITKNNMCVLIWNDNEYFYKLVIDDNVSDDDLIKMLQIIKIKN